MTRMSNTKSHTLISGAVLAVSVGLLACSGPASSGGGFGSGTQGTGNNSDQGASSGGSSGGSTSSSSGGSSSSGVSSSGGSSTGGGSSGNSSSSGASTADGGGSSSGGSSSGGVAADGIPTAPGVTAGPVGATDLAAPPTAAGMQFETVAGAYQVAPGQEIFPNFCVTVPNNIQVGGFQSWMSIGSSHHFILYKGGTVAAGSSGSCTLGANNWMYASSTPGQVITENFPANVGLSIPANTQLILNMHFINPGSTTLTPQIKVNLLYAQNVKYQAGTMVSFNTSINIPAATASGPGTQTVSGTCSAPTGANFFTMSTHTHKHATAAWIDYVHNGTTTEIVHTGTETTYPTDQEPGSGVDWEHPGVGLWTAPNFLTVQAGDTFTYHCAYTNTQSNAVTVGETAANNEMCMAIGYYYPAGSAPCN
jgi:hypothetical protein